MLFSMLFLTAICLEVFRRTATPKNPIYWVEQLDEDPLSGRAETLTTIYRTILGLVGVFFALKLILVAWQPGIIILQEILLTMIVARSVQFIVAGCMVVYMESDYNPFHQKQRQATVRQTREQEQASLTQRLAEITAQLEAKQVTLHKATNALEQQKQALAMVFTDNLYQQKANAHEVEQELNTLMDDYVYPNKSEACHDSALNFVNRVYQKANKSTKVIKPVTEETLAGLLHLTSAIKGYTGEQKVAQMIQAQKGQNDILLDSLDLSMMYRGDHAGDNHTNQIDQLLITSGGIFIFEIKNWRTKLAKYAHEGSEIGVYLSSGGYLEFKLELRGRDEDDIPADYFPKKGMPVAEQTANHVRAVKQLLMKNNMWDFAQHIYPVIVLAEDNEHYYIKNDLHTDDPYLTTVNDVVDYIYQDRKSVFSEADMYRIRKIILDNRFEHEEKRYQYTFFNHDSSSWQQFLDVIYNTQDYDKELGELEQQIDAINSEIAQLSHDKMNVEYRLQELKQGSWPLLLWAKKNAL